MTKKEIQQQQWLKEAAENNLRRLTRRHFLKESRTGIGLMALGSFLGGCDWLGAKKPDTAMAPVFDPARPLAPRLPHFAAKAKSVIYLHMAGAPSQLELFD